MRCGISKNVIALVVLVLVGTGGALAGELVGGAPDFVFMGPEERQQELRRGVMEFLGSHSDLSTEQVLAIQDLADTYDRQAFLRTVSTTSRERFGAKLGKVGEVLSYWDYLQLLRTFSDEFRVWMVENQFATVFEANTPECNCDSSQDCDGGSCNNVTCIHVGGTSHNGRCAGTFSVE